MQAIHPLFKGVLQDIRAEDEAQTRDPQLGRLMLYQLSYFRKNLCFWFCSASGKRWIRTTEGKNQQIYSLPHLATLVSSQKIGNKFRADGGIRTPDQLITNQLLWPTELHRHVVTNRGAK